MRYTHYCFENNWYYVTTSDAKTALQMHGRKITYLVPFWFGVTETGGLVGQSDEETLTVARQFNLPILAIVHNFASPEYESLIHSILTNNYLRQNLVDSILTMLFKRRFIGVNIDFEFVPPEDRHYLNTFMAELYHTLKRYGFLVTISVPPELQDDPTHPFSGAFSYPTLSIYSDAMYVLAYDEHVAEPGPIASIGFVREVLSYSLSVIPRHKIRLGMAVYGRDWNLDNGLPTELSYAQAINLAASHNANIQYDENAQELTYTYVENGVPHRVWFHDVRSFHIRLNLARQLGIPGIAVWRLGLEDPRIWNLF
ncbi:MAG: glycosyl hydrolase family 18 protein [Desulfotomaculaceae bacterium]|nr:glycosyl hydrolase family 18 protein [Desulfotomaculaceae bacterium]